MCVSRNETYYTVSDSEGNIHHRFITFLRFSPFFSNSQNPKRPKSPLFFFPNWDPLTSRYKRGLQDSPRIFTDVLKWTYNVTGIVPVRERSAGTDQY